MFLQKRIESILLCFNTTIYSPFYLDANIGVLFMNTKALR